MTLALPELMTEFFQKNMLPVGPVTRSETGLRSENPGPHVVVLNLHQRSLEMTDAFPGSVGSQCVSPIGDGDSDAKGDDERSTAGSAISVSGDGTGLSSWGPGTMQIKSPVRIYSASC